jgi:DNA primase
LNVNEEVLYTEVRKQKRKQTDDRSRAELRETARKKAAPQIPTVKEVPKDFLEEEIVFLRFLLKHCKAPLFEEVNEETEETEVWYVGEFMIYELEKDELISENGIFQKIFNEVKENLEKPEFDPWKYFVYHTDEVISKMATDLLSEKFIESNIWKRGGGFTEQEEDVLDWLIPKIIYEYKARKISLMLPQIEEEINAAYKNNDFEKVIEEQSKYINLKRVEKDLSDKLGNRTIN